MSLFDIFFLFFFSSGGNAVLMAVSLSLSLSLSLRGTLTHSLSPRCLFSLSCSIIYLGGPVGSGLRSFLSPSISLPSEADEWKDEVHLILEYKKGEEWGGVPAPRANRVILTHDVNNIHLTGLNCPRS
jgi:hypothetical protein